MSIAIIGGSGLDQLACFNNGQRITQKTPYGAHSGPVIEAAIDTLSNNSTSKESAFFLPRHSKGHTLPPHKVNYRANLWLLKSLGVQRIIACNVVGGITQKMLPGTLVIPHQIIDYTWGREHTFYDGQHSDNFVKAGVEHIDFSFPYSEALRDALIDFFNKENVFYVDGAVYACTQGPRLETAAEVNKLKNDGCDIVGMTAMPEAALARELDIDYVSLSLVVNWAPGIATKELSIEEIMRNIASEVEMLCEFMPDLINFLR